ncbi:hypothetical protein GBF38_019606, partial [Nibea albiflora]
APLAMSPYENEQTNKWITDDDDYENTQFLNQVMDEEDGECQKQDLFAEFIHRGL